jgi:hypothetical protein
MMHVFSRHDLYRSLGLVGKFNASVDDCLGGDYIAMNENDLLAIDREGRTIMTEHELE